MLGVGGYSRIVVKKKNLEVRRIIFSLARALASLGKPHYFPFGTRCQIGRSGGSTICAIHSLWHFLVLRKDDSRGGDLELQSFGQVIQNDNAQPHTKTTAAIGARPNAQGIQGNLFYFCIAKGGLQYRTRP